jgi:hypothetical protein
MTEQSEAVPDPASEDRIPDGCWPLPSAANPNLSLYADPVHPNVAGSSPSGLLFPQLG